MNKPKIILGIESSCDETAACIGEMSSYGKPSEDKRVKILSNVMASSADLLAKYGGVIPEQAAREQLKSIIPVIKEALSVAFPKLPTTNYQLPPIDAIAVTQGPGLIGSLLIGVETAKTLALVWNKSLIPVNHLVGHFYANWISDHLPGVPQAQHHLEGVIPKFPCIGLLVSGGHTDLVLMKGHGDLEKIGGTRDDAAGECFDKCARLLGLPYPGGPNLAKRAEKGNPKVFNLPRPMINSGDFDFSFSGLKTAVFNTVKGLRGVTRKRAPGASPAGLPRTDDGILEWQDPELLANLCASIEEAIVDVLVKKTVAATQKYKVNQIILAGGVAANQRLSEKLITAVKTIFPTRVPVFIPPPPLCTDNAAMIVSAAFYNSKTVDPLDLQANPNMGLTSTRQVS